MVNIIFDTSRCIKCGRCVNLCPSRHLVMTDVGPEAKSGPCMGCLQCAAACPQDAVLDNGGRATVPEPFDTVEALVMTRRSHRRYRPDAPDRRTIQWALDRAAYAPSGGNRRPTRWAVVLGGDKMAAVRETALAWCRETDYAPDLLKAVEQGRDPLTCSATVLIAGLEPEGSLNHGTDTVIALTTAELLLSSRGLGTCWGGYMRRIADRAPALRRMLAVPEGWHVCGCLLAGKPSMEYPNIPARPAAEIHWT